MNSSSTKWGIVFKPNNAVKIHQTVGSVSFSIPLSMYKELWKREQK